MAKARNSKATQGKCTVDEVVQALMAAHLCAGSNKAFFQQLGDALSAVRVYDPRDFGTVLRAEVRDLAVELLHQLQLMELYPEDEPF